MRKYKLPNGKETPAITELIGTRDFQNVIITLSDGSQHRFAGRAFTVKNDQRRITNIEFTEPKPLPDGYSFEEIVK